MNPKKKNKAEAKTDAGITIHISLYNNFHEPTYSETDCEDRKQKVYWHVYDSYVDQRLSV